jgi:hypothetical protein
MGNAVAKEATDDRQAVVILGMHRSGTSALTRSVSLCGYELPCDPLRPDVGNPKGYWESSAVVALNDTILSDMGATWDWPAPFICRGLTLVRCGEFVADFTCARYRDRAAAVLAKSFRSAGAIVVKDPRLCLLPELWVRALEDLGYRPRLAFIYRNPFEVAASLNRRNQLSLEQGLRLWLYYNLSVLREIERLGAVAPSLSFHALLADPAAAAAKALALDTVHDIAPAAQGRIGDFVSDKLSASRGTAADAVTAPQTANGVASMWRHLETWHDLDSRQRAAALAKIDEDCDGRMLLMKISGTLDKTLPPPTEQRAAGLY